ncbi:MAG: hypothetical protein HKN76_06590 [Saprospiraceae bacterium]|nr:hypothetical protein [Saprospiraceae bacterium]
MIPAIAFDLKFSMLCLLFILAFVLMNACNAPQQEKPDDQSYILAAADLPDYETAIDHRQLITSWDDASLDRGLVIYRTTCFPCHGDRDQPGSLPNSRKFWEEDFKNGHDPFSIYQTITRGHGEMPPQVHLVPQQKYDVIHFIRESFLKQSSSGSYQDISEAWLEALPSGTTTGPDPQPYHPWKDMDYGNWLMQCYELADSDDPPKVISGGKAPLANEDYNNVNFAYKGIAIRLDSGEGGVAKGNSFALFDHDLLRFVGAWSGEGFIDWESILLDDQHNVYPRTVGKVQAANPITPGWANPETGTFEDIRIVGSDGRRYGPLPRSWAHYKGLYDVNGKVIIKYSVGETEVLEKYGLEDGTDNRIFSRTLQISASDRPLKMRILPDTCRVKLLSDHGRLEEEAGFFVLHVPPRRAIKAKILFSKEEIPEAQIKRQPGVEMEDLKSQIVTFPASTLQVVNSTVTQNQKGAAYEVDIFNLPLDNPWHSRVRPTGIDFFNNGADAMVCTIDGEVWRVENIQTPSGTVKWSRIATGMFQPLGIKIHEDQIYVGCRDQIVKLHDINRDGVIDFYESFNNDHQVTEHFHEFAMGLQCDDQGNFYYAKSGRHARTSLVPQHGTLIKVSADGLTSTILANGFRAANGVCLNPDGSFYVTDQEGYWNPMNRINRVVPGGFYGNMWGYGAPLDSSDLAMEMPLCWVDKEYDRSPAELLWAESKQWGPLNGHLLSLSYGYGKIFVVLPQETSNHTQGGIVELPVPQFPTGLIRGRFNPVDGQLYTCGMSAWATNQMIQTGGLYRVRYNPDRKLNLPVEMQVIESGIKLVFSEALHPQEAIDTANFTINTWELKRTRNYGSKRYDVRNMTIEDIQLTDQNQCLYLEVNNLKPTWIMEIIYTLKNDAGEEFSGAIQNTIYALAQDEI